MGIGEAFAGVPDEMADAVYGVINVGKGDDEFHEGEQDGPGVNAFDEIAAVVEAEGQEDGAGREHPHVHSADRPCNQTHSGSITRRHGIFITTNR